MTEKLFENATVVSLNAADREVLNNVIAIVKDRGHYHSSRFGDRTDQVFFELLKSSSEQVIPGDFSGFFVGCVRVCLIVFEFV